MNSSFGGVLYFNALIRVGVSGVQLKRAQVHSNDSLFNAENCNFLSKPYKSSMCMMYMYVSCSYNITTLVAHCPCLLSAIGLYLCILICPTHHLLTVMRFNFLQSSLATYKKVTGSNSVPLKPMHRNKSLTLSVDQPKEE
jgi:uncharacterized membrane protein YciS (DUF1049 family)